MAIRFAGRSVARPRSADLLGIGQLTTIRFRTSTYHRPILRVPSVIVPREYNDGLFPEADGFDASITWTEPLNFDSRVFS